MKKGSLLIKDGKARKIMVAVAPEGKEIKALPEDSLTPVAVSTEVASLNMGSIFYAIPYLTNNGTRREPMAHTCKNCGAVADDPGHLCDPCGMRKNAAFVVIPKSNINICARTNWLP